MFMTNRRLMTLSLSLGLGILGASGAVTPPGTMLGSAITLAQTADESISASNGDAASMGTGNASSAPGTITRGDETVMAPSAPTSTRRVTESTPPTVNAPGATSIDIVPAEDRAPAAPPSEGTTDAAAVDTDGDWVADSDEVNSYGTDPNSWDTDGDGLSDGDELYVTGTDPFLWDTNGDGIADGSAGEAATTSAEAAPASDAGVATESTTETASVDSDNDRLADADEAAYGTDPSSPDADGDGYYDGDEVNLGTDPHDPASFPTS
jgi:hypothetical protein